MSKKWLMPVVLLALGALGLTGSSSASSTGLPPAITGKLTFDQLSWITHLREGVIEVSLPNGESKRLLDGAYPWRHPDGEITLTRGCGARVNRLVLADERGLTRVVSPCSSELETEAFGLRYEFSRLSPDKRSIAAEVTYLVNSEWYYSTVVIQDSVVTAIFDRYAAPEWTPDGRLILSGDGLYISDVDGEPVRIDRGELGFGVNNPDLDPTGQTLVFEFNQRLWTIDMDGSNLTELVSGPLIYRVPAWSPDGKHIAFLATAGPSDSQIRRVIGFVEVATGELSSLDLDGILPSDLTPRPGGPLSWTP